MADLFQGQTMTESYKFTTGGSVAATDFRFNFRPDKVVFTNLTQWDTTGAQPISTWYRDQTTAATAYQQQVIVDNGAVPAKNFRLAGAAGFTVADTAGGQATSQCTVVGITATDPVVVEHSAFTFQTNQIVRMTDLGQVSNAGTPLNRGMGQINNKRYAIVVIDSTHFSLKDVNTGEPIDGTAFTAWVSGGRICLETHVISLNNPQTTPYSNLNPYDPNPFSYDPVNYILTVDTSVLKIDSTYIVEAYKWGQITDLGEI